MFAAMLFAISAVAISQFGMYYWRAVLASVASQPVSESVLAAISAENRPLEAADFVQFAGLHALTPDLTPRGRGLAMVRFYYGLTRALNMMVGVRVPAVAQWIEQEGTICARYAAVQIDHRLQANLELAAALRSC
ncbi:MAG TPA: hypothetical protein VH140_11685 [Candidatus Acidoferrum sp.]|jgi:hypothetical protein|nr:hypothetical protein [Candidatus Acidoferrum sp.]